MHPEATQFVINAIQTYGPFDRVLEVGSRDVNGTIKSHFVDHGTTHYVGVDLLDGPNVDLVINFATIDLAEDDDRYDAVVCVNTLEHTPEGPGIFRNACRVLDAGGIFIMSAAHLWMPHGAFDGGMVLPGEHYANVTPAECVQWAQEAGFSRWDVREIMADVQCLAWK